jgi:hypothetical protein
MTAVACHVCEAHAAADLWKVLNAAARRHSDPSDTRMIVADSKMVYSPGRGLGALEHTVHAALHGKAVHNLAAMVDCLCPDAHAEVRRETWYRGTMTLPVEAEAGACAHAGQSFGELCRSLGITWGPIRSAVVCPMAFNGLLRQWRTKGMVLASSMVRLLRGLPRDDEAVLVVIDKHGGRNFYANLLQPAFDGGLVMAQAEGSQNSAYEVWDGNRHVKVMFQPRADSNHFCVALASMVSKYLRELFMLEFNRFWQAKVPGLKATAGYPGDAGRFWKDIRPAVRALRIDKDTLWRRW